MRGSFFQYFVQGPGKCNFGVHFDEQKKPRNMFSLFSKTVFFMNVINVETKLT